MKKYPINKITVEVEALGGEVTLNELTVEYRDRCNKEPEYDTPANALINAGLSPEQVAKLGENVAIALMNEVIDLTYPGVREEMKRMVEDGTYQKPSAEEKEKVKKNL